MQYSVTNTNLRWRVLRDAAPPKQGSNTPTTMAENTLLCGTGYPVPTAPGHGVDINEDYFRNGKQAELTGMVGGLRRKDGSLTNW